MHAKARKAKDFSIFFLMHYFPGYLELTYTELLCSETSKDIVK